MLLDEVRLVEEESERLLVDELEATDDTLDADDD